MIGVEPERCASYTEALKKGSPAPAAVSPTLADGLAVPVVGPHAFEVARHYVDRVVTVSERQVGWLAGLKGGVRPHLESITMFARAERCNGSRRRLESVMAKPNQRQAMSLVFLAGMDGSILLLCSLLWIDSWCLTPGDFDSGTDNQKGELLPCNRIEPCLDLICLSLVQIFSR